MTLIEKQTRDKYRHWNDKCSKMLSGGKYDPIAFDIALAQVKKYKAMLEQVPDEDSLK